MTSLMPVTGVTQTLCADAYHELSPIHLLQRLHDTVKGISRVSILYTRNEKR